MKSTRVHKNDACTPKMGKLMQWWTISCCQFAKNTHLVAGLHPQQSQQQLQNENYVEVKLVAVVNIKIVYIREGFISARTQNTLLSNWLIKYLAQFAWLLGYYPPVIGFDMLVIGHQCKLGELMSFFVIHLCKIQDWDFVHFL